MKIQKLPNHLINRLKAGEVVERPASVLKELIENAIDAGASHIDIYINDGGKKSIVVQDNGTGIEAEDLDMVLERYATSKIYDEKDLNNIDSYGFRGEALSAIAEVSKVNIQTKTQDMPIGIQLSKRGQHLATKKIATPFEHGTSVMIEDLFYDTPARLKFLKSSQTEYFYIYQLFIDFALVNRNISFALTKNDRQVFSLGVAKSAIERINNVFKKDREKKLLPLDFSDGKHRLFGVIGDVSLHFGSTENIKIFVNKRPVKDRIIRRAILDAFSRQLPGGTYPFAVIYLEIDPNLLDVNVHPRKMEVKFLDPGSIFQLVKSQIKNVLGEKKTVYGYHETSGVSVGSSKESSSNRSFERNKGGASAKGFDRNSALNNRSNTVISQTDQDHQELRAAEYKIIGQIWDSYIIVQKGESIFYIDQHALAERILFEQMKKQTKENGYKSELLLQPVTISFGKDIVFEEKIQELKQFGFDVSLFGEDKAIIYAVPQIFTKYTIDFDLLFQKVFYLDEISFDTILEEIFATKACKAAIKAGQKLSSIEMQKLIEDGFAHIDAMFSCQHGRPFFIEIERKNIEKMFDR